MAWPSQVCGPVDVDLLRTVTAASAIADLGLAPVTWDQPILARILTCCPRKRACVVLRYYLDLSEADTAAGRSQSGWPGCLCPRGYVPGGFKPFEDRIHRS